MPYVMEERVNLLKNTDTWPDTLNVGDLNAIFTLLYIDIWNANPCYQTIHAIREISLDLHATDESEFLQTQLEAYGHDQDEIITAKDLAFLEFYRRVATPYENHKSNVNGDIYTDTLRALYTQIYPTKAEQ